MIPSEIVAIMQNISQSHVVLNTIQALSACVLTTCFLRKDTSTQQFEQIKAAKFDEALTGLLNSGIMTHMELFKAKNFLDVAKKADEMYYKNKNTDINDSNYNFDWFINFFENVGNVSDETVQDIWARILAQEIDSPNSVSIKTINILKNIGRNEAILFQNMSKYSLIYNNASYIPNNDIYLKEYDIAYSDILLLNEYGLINNGPLVSLNFMVNDEYSLISQNDNLCIIAKSNGVDVHKISFNCFTYTSSGNEINNVLNIKADNDKLLKFAHIIRYKWKNTLIEVRPYTVINGEVKLGDEQIL